METRKISLIKIAAISFLLTIFWSASAFAQPNVTGFLGSLVHKGTLTITGTGFGTKATPAPLKWDDFENGVNGNDLSGWSLSNSGGINPQYSSVQRYAGNLSAYLNLRAQYNCSVEYKALNGATEVYLSYNLYWDRISGDPSRNIKLARITGGYINGAYVAPAIGYTQFDTTTSSIFYYGDGNSNYNWGTGLVGKGSWHRIEYYGMLSTAGVADGKVGYWIDSVQKVYNNAAITKDAGTTANYEWVTLPYYVAHDPGGEHDMFLDDVYIDNTRARVEIGNAPTWAASTHREIQIPSVWSGTSITITLNQGSFGNFNNAYLYVIDADGNVNENGYLLSDVGGNTSPPSGSDSSGSNASASGGSGCGFVKDDGKELKAKGEGLSVILLFLLLILFKLKKKQNILGGLFIMMNIKKSLLILLSFSLAALLFSYPAISEAATYYVSNNGSAAWAQCTNIDTPCAVQTAFNNAVAGDIVYFRGGTYNVPAKNFGTIYHGYYEPANSGTAGNPITFAAYSGETPIFNGTAGGTGDVTSADGGAADFATIFGTFGRSYIVFDGFTLISDNGTKMARIHIGSDDSNVISSYITIKNCSINGGSTLIPTQNNRETIRIDYGDDILIQRCRLYNARSTNGYLGINGIKSYNANRVTIENSEIYNTEGAIYLKSDTDSWVVRNNWLHDNQIGIYVTPYFTSKAHNATNHKFYNNVIANSSYSNIHVYNETGSNADNMEVYNNTIYDVLPSSYGILLTGGQNFRVYNNIIQGTTSHQLTFGYSNYSIAESDYNQFGSYSLLITTHLYNGTKTYNSITSWQASTELAGGSHPDTFSLASDPLFQNGSGTMSQLNDFRLANNSPSKGTGKGGVDMGANIDSVGTGGIGGGDIPPPSDGGNTPPSSSSGSDSSASGGGGCGFVKDINGKGQKAKGEGVAFAIMLIMALAGVAIAKRRTGNSTATKKWVGFMETRKNSLIKIAAISFLLTIFCSASAYAQPQITDFSGSLTDGSTITINGNSFGVNGPNIVIFDDFESGTNGSNIKTGVGSATLGGWSSIFTPDNPPKYDNKYTVSGSLAYKGNATVKWSGSLNDSGAVATIDGFNATDVFVSYWYYKPITSQWPCYNGGLCGMKVSWLFQDHPTTNDRLLGFETQDANTVYNVSGWCNGCTAGLQLYSPALPIQKGKWYRLWYFIHGVGNSTDHEEYWAASPSTEANVPALKRIDRNQQVMNSGFAGFQHFRLDAYERWCNTCTESDSIFDDVYVAIGPGARARVEIGDAATYATSKNLSIATVTSWSDTSITATIRQGSFSNLNNAYLYVIDANGNVNENGYLLSDGGGSGTLPPSSGGGGDSSASGGSGCGFVKDNNDKGQGAKGEGLALMILLVLALTVIVSLRKVKYFKGLLFLIIFLFPFSIANAADYYVATNGNDSNPGTEAQPWQHIAWATCGGSYGCPVSTNNPNKLAAGDTLYVRGGTYSEYNIKFANSGVSGNLITIKSYPGETAIIDGGFTSASGTSSAIPVFYIDGTHFLTLQNLTIRRGYSINVRIGYDLNTTNITITNCEFSDVVVNDNTGHIYIVGNTDNILIEGNKFHGVQGTGTSGAGVHLFYAGNVTLRNNEIYSTYHGIYYKGSVENGAATIIENNLIHDVTSWGIGSNKRDVIMRNNIIYNAGTGGILVFEESSSCDKLVSTDNQIIHNTIVDPYIGIYLNRSTSCPGAVNTMVKDNLIYNFTYSGYRGLSVWPYYSVDNSNTTFDHNLIYSSNFDSPIRVLNNYYTTATAPLSGTGNIQQAPIFKDYANKDFTLMPNSPGYKAASDGYDMGADTSLPPTPTPDGGGGNTTPPPSSGSGGDSGGGSGGGSGCGFMRNDSNRVSKSQSIRATDIGLMGMFFMLLLLLRIRKKTIFFRRFDDEY